ncbi:MAG: hypothetical protein HY951_01250 [Bacteroidia bacterium]|nr:hypothetical protein [Bacteroidia bacterium]
MKNIKSILIYLSLLIIILIIVSSCSKKDNPTTAEQITYSVVGEWVIDTMESNITQMLNDGTTAKVKLKVNGDSIIQLVDSINTSHDTSITTLGVMKENYYRFNNDSKMEYLFHYELSKTWQKLNLVTNITTYDKVIYTYNERAAGTWLFINNSEKLSLVFERNYITKTTVNMHWQVDQNGVTLPGNTFSTNVSSEERTYSNGEFAQFWVLKDNLINKIVIERNIDHLVQSSTIVNGSSIGSSFSEEGIETISLKPRL